MSIKEANTQAVLAGCYRPSSLFHAPSAAALQFLRPAAAAAAA
jgi:hypothetical protein